MTPSRAAAGFTLLEVLVALAVVALALAAGLRVVLLHAINPWGFSWARRVTEDNVDLNRNFRDFSRPAPPGSDQQVLPAIPIEIIRADHRTAAARAMGQSRLSGRIIEGGFGVHRQ